MNAAPYTRVSIERHLLDNLVSQATKLYRKAHLTPDEWRYVNKRLRRALGLRDRPAGSSSSPRF